MTHLIDTIDGAVDFVLDTLPQTIVMGIPLAIGKPNVFVNALYRRIKANPARRLRILTALSLERPVGGSDLERRFLAPFVERVFGDYPDLEYTKDLRAGTPPPNIEVVEFFFKTGDYLSNALAQQNYISTNYTFVVRDMMTQGINLLAQEVAARTVNGELRLSLSSNTDTAFEMIERMRASGQQFTTLAVINSQMPFMPNQADVPASYFDHVVTDPAASHHLFGAPNMKVTPQDYAIGVHAASLVTDDGTLQIGIGALGDAISHALILREQHNDDFRRLVGELSHGDTASRELGRFEHGLYGCSEMFVNGFMRLIEAGIIRREVFADTTLQTLLNEKRIDMAVGPGTLTALADAGRIHSRLRAADVEFLVRFGILRRGVVWADGELVFEGHRYSADVADPVALGAMATHLLGKRLTGGIFMHGGFFLGPEDFYQRLRTMPEQELAHIEMHRIDFINQLYGHGDLARAQRRKARFINTTMMVTLLGAAVSDGLDSGAVVSGVGGQYNFVAMAHALPDARSILLLRATREAHGKISSNIVWNYGHTTIPRHLRDIVITEYGVADIRGQADAEIIRRLIAIADSRFQEDLVAIAKRHHKLPDDYEVPEAFRHNTPEALNAMLKPWREASLLPDFPFGTDLTPDELAMAGTLRRLKHATEHPLELAALAVKSLFADHEVPEGWLERLGLDEARDLKTMITRRLFVGNL